MAKLTLTDLTSWTNGQSSIANINNNNAAIETALENTLSRNGLSPNQMLADLDMNSNRIINLPEPVNASEPVRKQDIDDFDAEVDEAVAEAEQYAEDAALSAASAAGSVEAAANLLIGSYSATFTTALGMAGVDMPTESSAFRTTGYSVDGDYGAALYKKVVSEPSHTGKIQTLDGAWWEIAEAVFTPEMFGAKGDGVTDDTTAWQNLLNMTAPTIYVPKGQNYIISTVLRMWDNTRISGEGQLTATALENFTVPSWVGNWAILASRKDGSLPNINNIRIEGIALDTTAWVGEFPEAQHRAIHFFQTSDIVVTHCRFYGTGGATGCTGCYNFEISFNEIYCTDPQSENDYGNADGIIDCWGSWDIDAQKALITGNRIWGGGWGKWGIMITGLSFGGLEMDFRNVVVSNNIITDCALDGMWLFGRDASLDGITITGNTVDNCRAGIKVSDLTNFVISSNVTRNCPGAGVHLFTEDYPYKAIGCTNGTIIGNQISNCGNQADPAQGASLYLQSKTSNCRFIGNNIMGDAHYYGIIIASGCLNNSFANNYIQKSSRGGPQIYMQEPGQLVDGIAWTPTITGVSNVTSATLTRSHYYVHNNLTATVYFSIAVTAASAAGTQVRISLPIASNISSTTLFGNAAAGTATVPAVVAADATNDAALLIFTAPDTAARTFNGSFTYDII